MNRTYRLFFVLACVLCTAVPLWGQVSKTDERQDDRLSQLERKLSDAERQTKTSSSTAASTSGAAILFGAFCALWAQNTNRSAWLWFFLGLFFSVITVIVLLVKNSDDKFDRQQRDRFTRGRT